MKNLYCAVFAFTLAINAFAVESIPAALAIAVRTELPANVSVREFVLGDLNQDGIKDYATLIYTPTSIKDEATEQLQIAVFFGQKNGDYKLNAVSDNIYPHHRITEGLEIKNQSLYLSRGGTNYDSVFNEVFQFKMRENNLTLIGETSSQVANRDKANDFGKSINYLTGKVTFWRLMGKKRKEVTKSFSIIATEKLSAFNYEKYSSKTLKVPQGHIDEKFKFVTYGQ